MTEPDPWVAYLPLPRGYLMMEPADDRHPPEKYRTRYRSGPESCLVTSTAELGAVLVRAGTTLGQVAKERPDYLAYLLFSLTGRDPYSLVRESMWRDLELYCHLDRTTNLPA